MSIKYAREIGSDGLYEFAAANALGSNIETLLDAGFLPLYEESKPDVELGEFQRLKKHLRTEEDCVVKYYTVEDDDPELLQSQIDALVGELAESDYRVIKGYEEQLAGAAPSYDIALLRGEREAVREQVRALKARLA